MLCVATGYSLSDLSAFLILALKCSFCKKINNCDHHCFSSAEEIVEYIANDRSLFSTSDYVQKYTKPLDIVLDQEQIWPLEIRLFPYM